MEEYEDMESNALVAYNATGGTDAETATMRQEQDEMGENLQISGVPELQTERCESRNSGVLKATSGNAAKWKAKAETRHGAKERSTSLTALKMIARQGADEKSQLEKWKTELLHNLTKEIAEIHKAHNNPMETQREEMKRQREQLQFAMHVLGERIRELELEKEEQRRTSRSESVENTPEIGSSQTPREKVTKPSQVPPVKPKEQRSYATVAAAKPVQTQTQPRTKVGYEKSPEQPWTKVSYGTRKSNMKQPKSTIQQKQLGRRVLFPQSEGQEKSEADLMLALNKALQQAGEETSIRFIRVRYSPSGAISALLSEKADAGQLLPRSSNLLIRAVKAVDPAVVGIQILEHWQQLKVHGMS